MKKIKLIMSVAAAFVGSIGLNAQTTLYDGARLLGNDLNGTARFVGMGGAMGALGGDISTMGTNPAGIGIYRSSDAMVSFGLTNNGAETTLGDKTAKIDKFFGSFDNMGAVFAYKMGNHTALRYVNFGFNYKKRRTFDRNLLMNGTYGASQTEQMADMVNGSGASLNELKADNAYSNQRLSWLGILGYNSYLVNPWYKDGNLKGFNPYLENGDQVDGVYNARERGGLNAFDFNVAFNFYDRFYLGATLGTYYIDYNKNSTYTEEFFYNKNGQWSTAGGYMLDSHYELNGSGFDFKLGFILRPFERSPFRIGAAVHTPAFYRMTEYTSARIDFDVNDLENGNIVQRKDHTVTHDDNNKQWRSETPFQVITPWKYNFSLGYTIASCVALGAEYEYSDYSTMKLKYEDGLTMPQETQDVKDMMEGVHTLRLGAEFKLAPEFSCRLGYNHITAAMKDDAFKGLPNNSVRTDTDYANLKAANNYTLGFGYRGPSFYADMAYQYNAYKEDFYAFERSTLHGSKVNNNNHKVVFTLGMRF